MPALPSVFVQEITAPDLLRQALALRYQVYRATDGLSALPSLDPRTGLDLDAYDPHSRHLGLLMSIDGIPRVIGTLRFTSIALSPRLTTVAQVAAASPSLCGRLRVAPKSSMPSLDFLVHRKEAARFIRTREAMGERVVEAGRFALSASSRMGARRNGLWLAGAFIEAAVAWIAWTRIADRVLVSCSPQHSAMYRPFGFTDVPGTRECLQPTLGVARGCLHSTVESIPEPTLNRIHALAGEWGATGIVELSRTPFARRGAIGASRSPGLVQLA